MEHQAELWIKSLSGTESPADYFKHPLAFPMLLLPLWMEQTIHSEPDLDFQADLIYSSINGYYFIRMIDNVMDDHSTVEKKLLPLLGFFHLHFHAVYHAYFSCQHPFWPVFRKISMQSAESTLRDATMTDIDLQQFMAVAGRKVSGGEIPLAAVSFHYACPHVYEQWQVFYHRLGCWHQMYNDVFGWVKDWRNQTPSYFLSEGQRRKAPEQSIAAWVIREGFVWGIGTLETWLGELQRLAEKLRSDELVAYLQYRQQLMEEQSPRLARAIESLDRLLDR
jgi:hypothetical protein